MAPLLDCAACAVPTPTKAYYLTTQFQFIWDCFVFGILSLLFLYQIYDLILYIIKSLEPEENPISYKYTTTCEVHLQYTSQQTSIHEIRLPLRSPPSIPNMASASAEKKSVSVTRVVLICLATVAAIGIIVLLALLADDAFKIPYLTPLAKFLALIIAPFVPFIFPIYLGIFLKVCAYPKKEWAGKKRWIFITGCWGFSHTQRFVTDTWKIWGGVWKSSGDMNAVCGLDKCKGAWVEECLVLLVIIAQLRGWKWDNGLVEKWVEGVIKQEKIAAEKSKSKDLEKGEVVVEDDVDVDLEKRELMAKDGIVPAAVQQQRELLVEIEEEQVAK